MKFSELVDKQIVPLADSVVNLMYALAFIFFLYGIVKFFFIESSDEGRKNAKLFIFWSVLALAVLFSVWGIVKLLVSVLPT